MAGLSFAPDHIVGRSLDLHAPITTNVAPAHTQDICTEIYLIRHAESSMNTLPELIAGRCPSATVTPDGRREARALGVFLLSHGLHFDAVFSSSLERCNQFLFIVHYWEGIIIVRVTHHEPLSNTL